MLTHVAFLRGINVGGHTVTNDRLAEVVRGLGFDEVTTFQASGNVLFGPAEASPEQLAERLGGQLEDALGWPVPTFVRTAGQVHEIADARPFVGAPAGGKVHVGFLRAPLDTAEQEAVRGHALDTDDVEFDGSEVWWHVGTGRMMASGLGDPALARLLGDRWTLRTHATIQRIARKL